MGPMVGQFSGQHSLFFFKGPNTGNVISRGGRWSQLEGVRMGCYFFILRASFVVQLRLLSSIWLGRAPSWWTAWKDGMIHVLFGQSISHQIWSHHVFVHMWVIAEWTSAMLNPRPADNHLIRLKTSPDKNDPPKVHFLFCICVSTDRRRHIH